MVRSGKDGALLLISLPSEPGERAFPAPRLKQAPQGARAGQSAGLPRAVFRSRQCSWTRRCSFRSGLLPVTAIAFTVTALRTAAALWVPNIRPPAVTWGFLFAGQVW
jgi:hypothetical protein